MANLVKARVDAVRRLTRRRVSKPLERVLEKASSEDIASALGQLTLDEMRFLIEHLGDGGEILVHLSDRDFERAVQLIPFDRLVRWLDGLETDDEADVIARLPEELLDKVLSRIQEEDREQVEELLAAGLPAERLERASDELDAARRALDWSAAGDLLLLTTHAQRDELLALLRARMVP